MQEIKDSKQATVRIGFDGRVYKRYHGTMAKERFENEVRVLRYLDEQGCRFVPRLLAVNEDEPSIVTTNCGQIVEKISEAKQNQLFQALEQYGVRHEDRFARNITYDAREGRFCLIDFEFATILATNEGLTLEEVEAERKRQPHPDSDLL